MFSNLQDFIKHLEKNNQLARIKTEVKPELEITEIYDRVVKQEVKALHVKLDTLMRDFNSVLGSVKGVAKAEAPILTKEIKSTAKKVEKVVKTKALAAKKEIKKDIKVAKKAATKVVKKVAKKLKK
jgi:UbiD family decarboxylase